MKLKAWLKRRFRRSSSDPRAVLVKRAHAAKENRDWRGAAALYAQALALRDAFGTRVQLAHMLKEAKQFGEAEEHYLKALQQKPDDADLHLQLGHFYWVKGDPEAAVAYYRQAADLAPGDAAIADALIIGERRAGDAPFQSAIDTAMEAMGEGRWRDAEIDLRPLVEHGRSDYLAVLGQALKEQGRLDEAVDSYRAYRDHVAARGGKAAYESEVQLAYTLKLARRFSEAAAQFSVARQMRMEREGWTGSVDELLGEIRHCIAMVHPALDASFIK